jgi:Signal transduction histidine kinase
MPKILKKILKSMRFWLIVCIGLAGFIPLRIYGTAVSEDFRKSEIDAQISELTYQGEILRRQLISKSYMQNPTDEVMNAVLQSFSDLYDSRIIIIDRSFQVIKDTYHIEEGKFNISEGVLRSFVSLPVDIHNAYEGYIDFVFPIYEAQTDINKEGRTAIGILGITSSTRRSDAMITEVLGRTALLEISLLLLLILTSFIITDRLMLPINRLIKELRKIENDGNNTEISVNIFEETKSISSSISSIFKRLKVLDESRQEFVSNVSHELKTPLTSMRVLADSLNSQEEVPLEIYKEFMLDISEEIDRESKIIDALLALVRMDKGVMEFSVQSVAINEIIKSILKRLRPIANQRNIELIFESIRPVTADVDEVKITLAISNLIENAIKYNVEEGWVKVTLDADHKFCYINVADSGLGIPEEFQSHIFERFYRVDKARSRERGGVGLGLSITKGLITRHKGVIKVQSVENSGTTFTVRIPLHYIV